MNEEIFFPKCLRLRFQEEKLMKFYVNEDENKCPETMKKI